MSRQIDNPQTYILHLPVVSDIFYFFSARGGGRGSPRLPGRGGFSIFYGKSQGGGLQEGKGPRGREGVCGELGILEGGGD